ncbi:MAG: hypothetical protein ACE5K8_09915 [Candidatus Zixiibacteriota bacterium]
MDGDYLWIAYRSGSIGLSRYDKVNNTCQHYTTANALADDRISKIYVGKDAVWFLYRGRRSEGVTKYDKRTHEWVDIKPKGERRSGVVDIAEDGDYIWLATSGEGLKRYHLASGTWTNFTTLEGLAGDRIFEYSLKVDDRYVFVGTSRGFSIFDKRREKWLSYTRQDYVADKEVIALAADGRYLWVGTRAGISRYDKRYDEWKTYQRRSGSEQAKV